MHEFLILLKNEVKIENLLFLFTSNVFIKRQVGNAGTVSFVRIRVLRNDNYTVSRSSVIIAKNPFDVTLKSGDKYSNKTRFPNDFYELGTN